MSHGAAPDRSPWVERSGNLGAKTPRRTSPARGAGNPTLDADDGPACVNKKHHGHVQPNRPRNHLPVGSCATESRLKRPGRNRAAPARVRSSVVSVSRPPSECGHCQSGPHPCGAPLCSEPSLEADRLKDGGLDLAIKTKKEAHGKSRQSQARPKGKNKPNTEKISIIVCNFSQKHQLAFQTSVASRSA